MKVWITKYALTKGILEKDAKWDERYPSMVSIGPLWTSHKPDWHESREEAVKHAEKMRIRKITSLHNSIAKLEKMKF